MKARVAAPEPSPSTHGGNTIGNTAGPTTGGVWIAVLVVVGTSVGMLALSYDRAASNAADRAELGADLGGPLVGVARGSEPTGEAAGVGAAFEHEWVPPHRPAVAVPAPAADETLADASRRVPIELYSATWCSACATAHRWLDANDIRYEEIDVDRRPGAREQLTALNPRRSLPTFDIDGDVLVGFDPSRLGSAITTAAARH